MSGNFSLKVLRCWNRHCGCHIPGSVQSQGGWSPGKPDPVPYLVVGGPVHTRGVELNNLGGPFQIKAFYDSMTIIHSWDMPFSSGLAT